MCASKVKTVFTYMTRNTPTGTKMTRHEWINANANPEALDLYTQVLYLDSEFWDFDAFCALMGTEGNTR